MTQINIEDGKHLLGLIERVDHTDEAALDEIDARAWCLFNNKDAEEVFVTYPDIKHAFWSYILHQSSYENFGGKYYTHSLDACAAAQLPGWEVMIAPVFQVPTCDNEWEKGVWLTCVTLFKGGERLSSPELKTIPLAWTHANIQSRIWEAENE